MWWGAMPGEEEEVMEMERIRAQTVPPKLFNKIARRLRRCDPGLRLSATADFIANLIIAVTDNFFEGLAILKQAEAFLYWALRFMAKEEKEEFSEESV